MDVNAFYGAVTTASFTLLGLWWVVVEARPEWRRQPARRRLAYTVMLHFLLPGLMAILSMVAPDVGVMWRASFAIAAVCGLIGVVYVLQALQQDKDAPRIVLLFQRVAIAAYAVVAVVAVAPALGGFLPLLPLQVEGIAIVVILFLGIQSAAALVIEPDRTPDEAAE